MNDFFFAIIFIGFVLGFFSYGIAFYMNLWIYYSADKNNLPFFRLVSPFSYSSYEWMLKSMFKLNWKVENDNKKLKQISNKLRKFSGIMLLITIATGILSLFVN